MRNFLYDFKKCTKKVKLFLQEFGPLINFKKILKVRIEISLSWKTKLDGYHIKIQYSMILKKNKYLNDFDMKFSIKQSNLSSKYIYDKSLSHYMIFKLLNATMSMHQILQNYS